MGERCHECERETDESCERCRRPTCPDSYYEREHLGLCRCCYEEIAAPRLAFVYWPHRLRKPIPPGWTPPPPPS